MISRGVYGGYRLVSALRYRVRRRLTPPGLAVLACVGVAGAMAFDVDNSSAYQAFALLLFLLLVAALFALRFRVSFAAERRLPRFGTAGVPLTYRILLRQAGPGLQAGLALLENLADPRPSFREWRALQRAEKRHLRSFRVGRQRSSRTFKQAELRPVEVPVMAPGQSVEVVTGLTPLRRGVLRLTGVTLARPDPLGLFRAFARLPLAQSVVVLPRRYFVPPVAMPGLIKYQRGGVAMAASVGESEEFVSLRDYRRGDPYRHIHWRSWAKAGKPIVKEFQDEFFVRHALVLDTFLEDPRSDAFEEAISIAASFACTVQTQESLLDLMFVGSQAFCFTAGRGVGDTDHLLEVLASVRPSLTLPFDRLEGLVLNHVASVSGCILVLVAWDDARRALVQKLKELGVPLLVLVVVEADEATQLDPGPLRAAPQQFHVLRVGEVEQALAKL